MLRSGNKKVAGLIGVGLILAAAWLGVDISGEETTNDAAPTTTSAAPTTATTSAVLLETTSGLPACTMAELPHQADLVVEDIRAGGPFDYPDNDGTRFGNYEGVLPDESGNYYREYTVETPGLTHRGPLRIVTGGSQETDPDVWYYTEDHYDSFCEITDLDG